MQAHDLHKHKSRRRVSTTIAYLLFALLLCLLVALGIRNAERLHLYALLASSPEVGTQSADDDTLFYSDIGNAPFPLSVATSELHASYTIELGMTTDAKEADDRVKELSRMGLNAFYTPLHQGGKALFRIRVGLFPSEELAGTEASHIKGRHAGLDPKVSRL